MLGRCSHTDGNFYHRGEGAGWLTAETPVWGGTSAGRRSSGLGCFGLIFVPWGVGMNEARSVCVCVCKPRSPGCNPCVFIQHTSFFVSSSSPPSFSPSFLVFQPLSFLPSLSLLRWCACRRVCRGCFANLGVLAEHPPAPLLRTNQLTAH